MPEKEVSEIQKTNKKKYIKQLEKYLMGFVDKNKDDKGGDK